MRFGVLPLRGQPAGVQGRDGRIPGEENLEADVAGLAEGCRRRKEADGGRGPAPSFGTRIRC